MHFNTVRPEFAERFFELIKTADRIIITGHIMPDDDSVASVLAIYDMLQQKQKPARIIYSAKPDNRFSSFKHYDKIEFVPDIADVVQPSDTLIVVDGSQLYRFWQNRA